MTGVTGVTGVTGMSSSAPGAPKLRYYRRRNDGILAEIRLSPKASRDEFSGVRRDAGGKTRLIAKVRAAPENNRANMALVALLAKALKRPKSDIEIVAGATSRTKTVLIRVLQSELSDLSIQLRELGS